MSGANLAPKAQEATRSSAHREQIVAWLRETNPDATTIDNTTDLFESGLVTSIQFVELVLLVEELSGQEIAVDDNAVERFRTLQAISDNYFA